MIFVTGATGYVGGRLVDALMADGRPARALVRRPEVARRWRDTPVEIAVGDVFDREALDAALKDVSAAFYLIHSMNSDDFEARDREAARAFATAAKRAGVDRVVYLGGLADPDESLSAHLRSRIEVGDILRREGPPTVELRASIVLGAGSLSFEMIRALVERLPVMVTPKWVRTQAQPIAIGDALACLTGALDIDAAGGAVHEIAGAERISYGGLMREYARQRGLRRLMIPAPVLTPGLSSLWLALVTPMLARVGRRLIDSIPHASVARENATRTVFGVRPLTPREAIARAISEEDRAFDRATCAAYLARPGARRGGAGDWVGNRVFDARQVFIETTPTEAFAPVRRIGGRTGWHYANGLWRLRGWMDRLAGGPGMVRGRVDPERLAEGEALDCWRVERFEPDRRLRLRAEMRLPGRAWLEFEVRPHAGGVWLRQTAVFDPRGLTGLVYWLSVMPLHQRVFQGMLEGAARATGAPFGPVRRLTPEDVHE